MSDITIVKERGKGGIGTMARLIPHNEEATQILEAFIERDRMEGSGCFIIHSEAAEEMAETLREKGLDVDIK